MNNEEVKIKRTSKGAIVAIIIGTILFIVGTIVGVCFLIFKLLPRDYIGSWECNSDKIKLEIDNDNFKLYNDYNNMIDDDYSVSNIEIKKNSHNYYIKVGNNVFDLSISNNRLYMIDKSNYDVYVCTKK